MVGVHVGDRAGGGDAHVAADQGGADGGTGLDRFRLLAVAEGAYAHDRHDPSGGELRRETLERSWLKPLKTSGVAIGFELIGKTLTRTPASPGADVFLTGLSLLAAAG